MSEPSDSLREQFGDIDVYLFDQLLRGRIVSGMKVLDAGCGSGRNLIFLMRAGFDVWGVDESEEAIAAVQRLANQLAPELPQGRFRVERVESMSHDTDSMDAVISSAVLHFARDASHWLAMVHEMWRVLAPGGLLFARLATTVGQPNVKPLGGGRGKRRGAPVGWGRQSSRSGSSLHAQRAPTRLRRSRSARSRRGTCSAA